MCEKKQILYTVMISFLSFMGLYFFMKAFPFNILQKKTFVIWVLAFVHASLITILGADVIVHNFTHFNETNQEQQCILLAISMGYFIHDMIHELIEFIDYLKKENNNKSILKVMQYIIHHVLVLSFEIIVIKQGWGASELCFCLFIYEISTIFLAVRGALIDIGLKNHILTTLIEITWFITFVIFRMILAPYILIYILFYTRFNEKGIFLKILVLSFHCLNMYWLWLAIQKLMKKFFKHK